MFKTVKVTKVEKLPETRQPVYDITVKNNHNFFIRPKGSENSVLVSNCHMLSGPAAQALLKILEDTPKRTLWLLSTTNPEKLPPTILGRCYKMFVRRIEREAIKKRLLIISKKEGHNIRNIEKYNKILDTIVDLSNGRMRDSIQHLESVLFAIAENENITADDVIAKFLITEEADIEKLSAELLVCLLTNDFKGMVRCVRTCSNARALLTKLRWLLQYLLDNSVDLAKFKPYNAKIFSDIGKKNNVKPTLALVLKLQYVILQAEASMNTITLDEQVVLMIHLGQYLNDLEAK